MEVFEGDLAVLVDVIKLHKLEDAVRAVQVYEVLVLLVGEEVAVDGEEAHIVSLFVGRSWSFGSCEPEFLF